jgi:hypothetical protein
VRAKGSKTHACRVQLALQVVERPAVGVECIVCQLYRHMRSIQSISHRNHHVHHQQAVLKLGQVIQQSLPTSCNRVFRMSTYWMKPHMLLPHLLGSLQFKAFRIGVTTITAVPCVACAPESNCSFSSPQANLDPLPMVDVPSCKPSLKLHSSMLIEQFVLRLRDCTDCCIDSIAIHPCRPRSAIACSAFIPVHAHSILNDIAVRFIPQILLQLHD